MTDLRSITPKKTERMIVVGATGTGKSTLVRQLLPAYKSVLAIDPIGYLGATDGKGHLDGYKLAQTPDEVARLGKRHKLIQYRPRPEFHYWEPYDQVFHWVFERGNTLLFNDEAYRVMRNNREAPTWLNACSTAGRQRGVGMITCTQRPTGIDLRLLSEAEHYVCFRLRKEVDRKRMAEVMGDRVVTHPARGHAFWYMRDEDEEPSYWILGE